MERKRTCLVAGGAGFIGSHLTDTLLTAGYRVVVVDNLITGTLDNLETSLKHPDFQFFKSDVTKQLNNDFGIIDFIFHLASPASVPDYQNFPKDTALANSVGTLNLLERARKHNVKFLFASTSEIYGDPLEHPQKESYWGNVNPIGVRSCYDESKRFGETLTLIYRRHYNVDARIIRIFNTYGPRMRPDDGRVVSNFINQILHKHPLTVYGDGTQTRSFCYVSDLVDGMLRAMFAERTTGEVFNIGNPEEQTVNNLAHSILKLMKSTATITHKDLPQDDPVRRKPDISKAQKILHWSPKISMEEGLTKTIEYYRLRVQPA